MPDGYDTDNRGESAARRKKKGKRARRDNYEPAGSRTRAFRMHRAYIISTCEADARPSPPARIPLPLPFRVVLLGSSIIRQAQATRLPGREGASEAAGGERPATGLNIIIILGLDNDRFNGTKTRGSVFEGGARAVEAAPRKEEAFQSSRQPRFFRTKYQLLGAQIYVGVSVAVLDESRLGEGCSGRSGLSARGRSISEGGLWRPVGEASRGKRFKGVFRISCQLSHTARDNLRFSSRVRRGAYNSGSANTRLQPFCSSKAKLSFGSFCVSIRHVGIANANFRSKMKKKKKIRVTVAVLHESRFKIWSGVLGSRDARDAFGGVIVAGLDELRLEEGFGTLGTFGRALDAVG
ncbi:hypothetical protein B0H17DRAFT_1267817 [Mycena rosella]|uniref:Uncharacterized protein n=1 Tax=Mycena rosella TaxID=1033263 RepID=A0AAD7G2Y3_MYCRO|nr:hypothetical protein B0H17DRAFT_1267817 [Mycena rosella]